MSLDEQLESLNPVPDHRGNPGPLRRSSPWQRPLAAAAVLAVLAGLATFIVTSVREDEVATRLETAESPPPDEATAGSAAGDERARQDDADPDAPVTPLGVPGSNAELEDAIANAGPIPWPEPVRLELSATEPETIELEPGLQVFEVTIQGRDEQHSTVVLCEGFQSSTGSSWSCDAVAQRQSGLTARDTIEVIAHLEPGVTYDLVASSQDELAFSGATVLTADAPAAPTLGAAVLSAQREPGFLEVSRLDGRAQIVGTGWGVEEVVVLYSCSVEDHNSPIDRSSCVPIEAARSDARGSLQVNPQVPGAALSTVTDQAASPRSIWMVVVSDTSIAAIRGGLLLPGLDPRQQLRATGGEIDVAVVALREGERAEVTACSSDDEFECALTGATVEVVGSGSGRDEVVVPVAPEDTLILLSVEGVVLGGRGIDVPQPVPLPAAGPGEITVSPAVVPAPGSYEFTVTGRGWTVAPPVFVLPCEAVLEGESAELGWCDTTNLTPATPADGSWEVKVTYDVGRDGLLIAAVDAAQERFATFEVTIDG